MEFRHPLRADLAVENGHLRVQRQFGKQIPAGYTLDAAVRSPANRRLGNWPSGSNEGEKYQM
ncbi:MAG: hypothetical protein OXC62_01780 [Aestuariivita sp.]|nr:hypothetical protein [Aestuariivita sp.]